MVYDAIIWSYNRFRPREGWLAFSLLLAIVVCMAAAILEVDWVPESGVVGTTAVSVSVPISISPAA